MWVGLLTADNANAAGSEDHTPLEALLYQIANVLILLGVIFYFARKPIIDFLANRRDQIQGDVAAAAELLSEAEARHREIQGNLANLESEIENLQEQSSRRAEEEAERILAEARRSAERIQADATAAIDQELLRAQRELRSEAAGLAVDMAGDILKQQVSDTDRERLLDEFIDRVESGNETPTRGADG